MKEDISVPLLRVDLLSVTFTDSAAGHLKGLLDGVVARASRIYFYFYFLFFIFIGNQHKTDGSFTVVIIIFLIVF